MSVTGFDSNGQQMLCARFNASRQWDRALEAAREWLANDPRNARAHQYAAQALINLKRHAEAEPHLQQVLATQPQNATAHRLLSMVLFELKRYRAADEAIHKAISLRPGDFYNWHHLASMFYRQGDLASARKYGAKAREINPRNPDIINFMALCEPRDAAHSQRRLEHYRQALELDPQNSNVHNNLGVYYLNEDRNYPKAEECFRRALFFSPTSKLARSNLFNVLKFRDPIYRYLRAPKDILLRWVRFIQGQNFLVYIGLLPVFFVSLPVVIWGLLLWFALVWPMIKVYEVLTLGDIHARAGEIGARRGGLFGYRRWSVRTRLGIFATLLLVFWSSVGLGVYRMSRTVGVERTKDTLGEFLLTIGISALVVRLLMREFSQQRLKEHVHRRGMRFDGILDAGLKPRRWWQLWRP